jgi:hypothetical protein
MPDTLSMRGSARREQMRDRAEIGAATAALPDGK